jgi:hypothetical protein
VEQTVSAASPNAGTAPVEAKPVVRKDAAEGPQEKIGISVETCGRGTQGSIECWGYVSNLSNANSRIALDHADVVDGKGNSFTVGRGAQLSFPDGHTSTIAPGSRTRYTIKVPDKDQDARSLTLYVDLSSPHSLEYTFRDVPVVNN